MRPSPTILLLASLAVAATCAWATIGAGGVVDANPEDLLSVPQFGNTMPSKNVWPELVGRKASEAKAELEAELPNTRVYLVSQGSMMTMDFRTDRIRIIYNEDDGLVVTPPRVG